VLPQGYISPKAARAVRDVWRKRSPLVRQPTATVLSLHNIIVRPTGVRCSAKRMQALPLEELERLRSEPDPMLAVTSRLAVVHGLGPQITTLAQAVSKRLQPTPAYEQLPTVEGSGTILAQTLGLETGALGRFPRVGHDASYCRCGGSTTISNGKRQGPGNVKHGHPYLEWASREAAQLASRCSPTGPRLYQRQ
jgi:transposase